MDDRFFGQIRTYMSHLKIRLHKGQTEVFRDQFVLREVIYASVCASRGYGKTHLGAASGVKAAFELMDLDLSVPNKNIFITAPSYAQVTDIYYPLLVYGMGLGSYCISHSKDTGRLVLPKGVEIRLLSYEALDRVRGLGCYYAVNDEVRDWTKGTGFMDAWQSIIQPCIVTRWDKEKALAYGAVSQGRALTITTPRGYDDFYDYYNLQDQDKDYKSYHYDYTKSPLLNVIEIEKLRHILDPISFAREYLASFEESGNRVFYCFDRKKHVRQDLEYFRPGGTAPTGELIEGEDVHIGIDFNVALQCSSAFAIRGGQVHYLDEFKGSPDTEQLALAIRAKYWPNYNNAGHPDYNKKICKITCYPDPTGKSRKTSAPVGQTDFTILQMHGFIVRSRDASPSIVDSVACVNRMLLTAAGDIHMYVHPRCTGLITSLERTSWLENNRDTATIDKTKGVEHFSDGTRYPIELLFPIRSGTKAASRGFMFTVAGMGFVSYFVNQILNLAGIS